MIVKKVSKPLKKLLETERFTEVSHKLSVYLREQVHKQGEAAREFADILHGKQIGHALHPILTALTVGSWTSALFFDVLGFVTRLRSFQKTGDYLTIVGFASAFPSALTGLTDYSTIKKDAAGYAAAHGLINSFALYAYTRSILARLMGHRFRALWFASLGFAAVTLSSWLGGEMVYTKRVGVNHAEVENAEEWQAVLPVEDLPLDAPKAVEMGENTVLLFRNDAGIFAIHNVCSHAGGPLDEGQIVDDVCIQCPWHQSVFDMRDGHVVHAPATVDQPRYQVRERDGQIEIRKWDEKLILAEDDSVAEATPELAAM